MWTLRLGEAESLVRAPAPWAVELGLEVGLSEPRGLCSPHSPSTEDARHGIRELHRVQNIWPRLLGFSFVSCRPSNGNMTLPFENLKNKTQTYNQPPSTGCPRIWRWTWAVGAEPLSPGKPAWVLSSRHQHSPPAPEPWAPALSRGVDIAQSPGGEQGSDPGVRTALSARSFQKRWGFKSWAESRAPV